MDDRDALKVALVQSSLSWHDDTANRATFDRMLCDSPAADLYVLPEMFATGFTMDPDAAAESMDGPSVRWLSARARERDAALCGSLAIRDGDAFVNRFVFAHPDGRIETYDKRHLFALAGEDRAYRRGHARVILRYRGWRIVPQICYDLRFPVWTRFARGCDLMLFVANWPRPRAAAWRTLLRARALDNQCYVAGVNRVGTDHNDKRYVGDSALIGPDGEARVAAGDVATVITASIVRSALEHYRERLPFYRDADDFELTGP